MVCYVWVQPQFLFLWAPPETRYGHFLSIHPQVIKSGPTWCGDACCGPGPRLAIVVLLGVGLQQLEPVPQTLPEIGQILSCAALCGGSRKKRGSMLQQLMMLLCSLTLFFVTIVAHASAWDWSYRVCSPWRRGQRLDKDTGPDTSGWAPSQWDMPAAPACTATRRHALTYRRHGRRRTHRAGAKWVIAALQIKYSWGEPLYALMQMWGLLRKCTFTSLRLHRRSGIVIQMTGHKSINTRESVAASHRLALLRLCITTLCLQVFPPRSRFTPHGSGWGRWMSCHYLLHHVRHTELGRIQSNPCVGIQASDSCTWYKTYVDSITAPGLRYVSGNIVDNSHFVSFGRHWIVPLPKIHARFCHRKGFFVWRQKRVHAILMIIQRKCIFRGIMSHYVAFYFYLSLSVEYFTLKAFPCWMCNG